MTYEHKDHMEWLLQKTDYYTENAVTEERIQEIREVYAKAKAYDEVATAYEYYMPNGETQFPESLAYELNRILIKNFVPPTDFSKFKDYSFENFNDHKEKSKAFDDGRDRIYSKISYIVMNTEPDKITPGYVNGMYHALDLLNGDAPDD